MFRLAVRFKYHSQYLVNFLHKSFVFIVLDLMLEQNSIDHGNENQILFPQLVYDGAKTLHRDRHNLRCKEDKRVDLLSCVITACILYNIY